MTLLVVHVGAEESDAASDWLWSLGALAIEERSELGQLVAGFADAEEALAVRSVIEERWPTRFEAPPDEAEWRDVWLRHLEPVTIGHVTVHPPWVPPLEFAEDRSIAVSIDPGRAFGSGHHASTQLAITALIDTMAPDTEFKRNTGFQTRTVLDVGCGTGVLSVVAAALGATKVLGVDLDLDIAELARTNAEANDQDANRVRFSTQDVTTMRRRFDVVVANMTMGTVSPLLPSLTRVTGGVLILSGLLATQLPRIDEALRTDAEQVWTVDEWAAARYLL